MTCPACGHHVSGLKVGDVLYGFCYGYFGRDSYGEKTVEYIGVARGKPFVIVSEKWWHPEDEEDPIMLHIYRGDPADLVEFRTPPEEG